jgi:hypothetical protein
MDTTCLRFLPPLVTFYRVITRFSAATEWTRLAFVSSLHSLHSIESLHEVLPPQDGQDLPLFPPSTRYILKSHYTKYCRHRMETTCLCFLSPIVTFYRVITRSIAATGWTRLAFVSSHHSSHSKESLHEVLPPQDGDDLSLFPPFTRYIL